MERSIVVDQLSKQYRIGESMHSGMLRESLVNLVRRPFRRRPDAGDAATVWALKGVSFEVGRNEVVGIVGRNGSGKTTLLKLLSRITRPTSGDLQVNGRVASLVEVGTGFHQELTGRENVYLNGSILGLKKREIDAQFDRIVEYSGVSRFIDTPIKRFSTGMRLRLGFAVAAHLSPDVLLVDEVLAVGDVEFQNQCLATLNDVGNRGRTVLFVSHNLEAIERLCPRTLWLDSGELRQDGPTREVIDSYLATISDSHETHVDLTEAERRSGTGEARFTGLELLEPGGGPMRTVRCGDALVLRLHHQVDRPVHRPYFGVMIATDLGTLVAHPNTWSAGLELPVLETGPGWIDLHIDALHLMPGRYSVTLWCNRMGDNHSVDLLEQCLTLHVRTSEDQREGRLLERRAGLVHLPATWHRP